MKFELDRTDGLARRARLSISPRCRRDPGLHAGRHLRHGQGDDAGRTAGNLGAQIILGNTFHLMLRPGTEIVKLHGDLHDLMHWQGPILTDSGGFQVFSLAKMRKISEQGVTFASPVDGAKGVSEPGSVDAGAARPRLGHRHVFRRVHALPGRGSGCT